MCYHTLYLFLSCGHCVPSYRPLGHSPPCPARSRAFSRRPSLASPIGNGVVGPWTGATREPQSDDSEGGPEEEEGEVLAEMCNEKLSHPLHTYRIAGLCLRCRREREERLARFEVGAIKDGVERESVVEAVREQRRTSGMEGLKAKEKIASPGLRSGYVEGRARRGPNRAGMILQRNGKGELVDGSAEGRGEQVDVSSSGAEAIGWDLEMGAFEGRRSGSWHRDV